MPNDQVPYSNIVRRFDNPAQLEGRVIRACYAVYTFAALLLDNEEVVAFAVEEESVGKWFEVFPIRLHSLAPEHYGPWTELEEPLVVARSELMWREEWLEPARDSSGFLGAGPHQVQYASVLGTAPTSNTNVVKVLAGLRLTGDDERPLVICSSDNTPFKVDLITAPAEIQRAMQFHTCE